MSFFEILFEMAPADGLVEFAVGGFTTAHRKFLTVKQVLASPEMFKGEDQVFFGPSVRKEVGVTTKTDILGSNVAWVDYDSGARPLTVLPPSVVVSSGNGWHLYWAYTSFNTNRKQIEAVNQALANSISADSAFDAPRLLRVPDTFNTKDNGKKPVTLVIADPSRVYSPKDLYLSGSLSPRVTDLILTGSTEGFSSRSERDWVIISEMLRVQMDEQLIRYIFSYSSCGDKYRETLDDGDRYMARTLERASQSVKADPSGTGIFEEGSCYYVKTAKGKAKISTFAFEPLMLLESDEEDTFMCNVRAEGSSFVWENFTIPKGAFTSVRSLSDHLPRASWVWLGRDSDIRLLQAHLIAVLQNQGMHRAYATGQLGYHTIPDDKRCFYVAENVVIASDGSTWANPKESPIVYVNPEREVPKIKLLDHKLATLDVANIAHNLCKINTPAVIWPALGWFAATPLKPKFEKLGLRFPILNVSGTRGSGKSTLIQKVFQKLMGYAEPRAYDANTTRFVTLTLLGSSLSVPVAFTEFRAASSDGFNRYVLMSYDTGRDPRGHADQTTTDYPLTAPFCIDGEDMLDDPAALERIIAVQPDGASIREDTECWEAFQELMFFDLTRLAMPYYFFVLGADLKAYVQEAETTIYEVFDEVLPSRVRANLIVAWTGVLLYGAFMASLGIDNFVPEEGAEVLRTSLELVYSPRLGRAPTAADEFVEVIINAAVRDVPYVVWELDAGILWIQLAPAYDYWVGQRVRIHKSALSKQSIRSQLEELTGEYVVAPEVRTIKGRRVLAFGFDLKAAYNAGLDVPEEFGTNTLQVGF